MLALAHAATIAGLLVAQIHPRNARAREALRAQLDHHGAEDFFSRTESWRAETHLETLASENADAFLQEVADTLDTKTGKHTPVADIGSFGTQAARPDWVDDGVYIDEACEIVDSSKDDHKLYVVCDDSDGPTFRA